MRLVRWKKRKRLLLPWWGTALVLAASAITISLAVVAIQPGSLLNTLSVFWEDPLLFALNGFPITVFLLLFWAIFANPLHAAAVTALIFQALSYVNLIKTECRGDPFVPDDIFLLREATTAIGEYSLDLHWGVLCLMLLFCILLFSGGLFTQSHKPKWFWRVGCGVLMISAFLCSMLTVYPDKDIYANRANAMSKSNVPQVFERCGFVYCFLHNYRLYDVEKPEGYDKELVEAWAAEQQQQYIQPAVQPNVIFIMCEAFSDLSDEEVFDYDAEDDPLAGFKTVASSENAYSGHIIVSNFGAGTANTEFDVLTGIQTNMLAEGTTSAFRTVHRNLNALPRAYAEAGYQTYFMHPGYSWFYNRNSVYNFLGMQECVFSEAFEETDKKGNYVSDAAFMEQLIADFECGIAEDAPLFMYTVTIQNHQAYPYSKYGFEPPAAPVSAELTAEQTETLSVYMEGIRDSSQMLLELTEYLDTVEEPTLLVFFGDHRPALLSDYGVYRALGVDVGNTDSPESVLNTYATPYVLWANEAYSASCSFTSLELPANLSSNYLGAVVYELTGLTGTDPYFDYLTQVRRSLPVLCQGYYVLGDGSITAVPNAQTQEIERRLQFWKYYRMKDEKLNE